MSSEKNIIVDNRKIVLKRKLLSAVSNVTVEPIVFCNFLALSFILVAAHSGLYEVICVQNFQKSLGIQCTHESLREHKDVETKVQKISSNVNMYLSLAYLIPAIVADIFLGAWADVNGRQVNILLGLAGLIVSCFPYCIIFTFPNSPLFILVIANFISGITGHVAIVMISSLAYLADIVSDKSKLTTRMAQIFVFSNLATGIGSFIVAALVQILSFAYLIMIAEILLAIGFVFTFFRIAMVPPLQMRKLIAAKRSGDKINSEPIPEKVALAAAEVKPPKSCMGELMDTVKLIGRMYQEFWHTFRRNRKGHRRCYIYLMTVVYLLMFIAELGLLHSPVLSLFVFHNPFNWSPTHLAYWKGTQALLLTVGNLAGSLIMKNLLHFKETTIIMICLTSGIAGMLVLAFSTVTWHLYLSVAIGTLANLAIPSIKSFIAQSVDPDEVGKAFTANGVTVDLALVLSTLLFNNIYSATVSYFPGAVFLLSAGLLAACWIIVLGVHIDSIRTERPENDQDIIKKPIDDNSITKL